MGTGVLPSLIYTPSAPCQIAIPALIFRLFAMSMGRVVVFSVFVAGHPSTELSCICVTFGYLPTRAHVSLVLNMRVVDVWSAEGRQHPAVSSRSFPTSISSFHTVTVSIAAGRTAFFLSFMLLHR